MSQIDVPRAQVFKLKAAATAATVTITIDWAAAPFNNANVVYLEGLACLQSAAAGTSAGRFSIYSSTDGSSDPDMELRLIGGATTAERRTEDMKGIAFLRSEGNVSIVWTHDSGSPATRIYAWGHWQG